MLSFLLLAELAKVLLLQIPSTGRLDSNLDGVFYFMLLPLYFNIPWLLNLSLYLSMKIILHGGEKYTYEFEYLLPCSN